MGSLQKVYLHKARRALLSWQGEVQVKRGREAQGVQLSSGGSFRFQAFRLATPLKTTNVP